MAPSREELPWELDVHAVHQLLAGEQHPILLDCREPAEFHLVHLEGAWLIPMQELEQRVAELQPYHDERIVVYCHHGVRSCMVTQWLRQQGFSRAQNMEGGIDAWSCRIDPTKPRY